MYPNLFLKTFWQMNLRPQIFVAMSFDDAYKTRFSDVIEPAIRGIRVNNVPLEPYRVDFSRSGDSILTDIIDGIAHCQMFVADVSVVGHDSKTGKAYRNGNVMYEVGLAVACRQSTEILLIRDDQDRFLFDVSTIPHVHIDFTSAAVARQELQSRLVERLRERDLLKDARVCKAIASLTPQELAIIEGVGKHRPPTVWSIPSNLTTTPAIARLCDKQLIVVAAKWTGGGTAFQWTQLGLGVVERVQRLPCVEKPAIKEETGAESEGEGKGTSLGESK